MVSGRHLLVGDHRRQDKYQKIEFRKVEGSNIVASEVSPGELDHISL